MSTRSIAVAALLLAGCAFDPSGVAPDESLNGGDAELDSRIVDSSIDSTRVDADELDTFAPDTTTDTFLEDTIVADTAPSDACTEAACGALPAGAKRVALVDRSIACPLGFKSTEVVEGTSGAGCGCSCAPSSSPTCPATGALTTAYGDTGTCPTAGTTLYPSGSGVCTSLGGSGTLHANFKGTAPAGYGGTCTPTATSDKSAIARPRRLCEPLAGTCAGPICGSPFVECIELAGACPSTFPTARTIGSDVVLTCPACLCSVSTTCTGTLSVYGGASCGGAAINLAVDGTCVSGGSATVGSYKYVPNAPAATCKPTFTASAGTRSFVLQRNLCCR